MIGVKELGDVFDCFAMKLFDKSIEAEERREEKEDQPEGESSSK